MKKSIDYTGLNLAVFDGIPLLKTIPDSTHLDLEGSKTQESLEKNFNEIKQEFLQLHQKMRTISEHVLKLKEEEKQNIESFQFVTKEGLDLIYKTDVIKKKAEATKNEISKIEKENLATKEALAKAKGNLSLF